MKDKNCSNCQCRLVCLVFNEYYDLIEKIRECNELKPSEREVCAEKLKKIIAKVCKSYIKIKKDED